MIEPGFGGPDGTVGWLSNACSSRMVVVCTEYLFNHKNADAETYGNKFNRMHNHKINFIGWILFVLSAIGFCIASIGSFWAMFGSIFFLIACLVFLIPFFRDDE